MLRIAPLSFLLLFALNALGASGVAAGEVFDAVRERGELRCGVQSERPGLAARTADGELAGFEIDLCRTWSVAVFGKADRVVFVPVAGEAGLKALSDRQIDVLALHEDALFGRREVSFAGNAFVDSLALMVRRADALGNALELDGKTICVSGGEEATGRLEAFASENRLTLSTLETDTVAASVRELQSGACAAVMAGRLVLAGARAQADEDYEILPELFSKNLLGPVTASDDRAWLNVIRWGVFAMIVAEEKGVSSENLASIASSEKDPAVFRLLGFEGNFGEELGLDRLWAYKIIESVGNYAEVYDRHFGAGKASELERGPNALWLDGGLMRAPPFL